MSKDDGEQRYGGKNDYGQGDAEVNFISKILRMSVVCGLLLPRRSLTSASYPSNYLA